ncbi:MAG: hypothetical protein ACRC33_23425 [Gemmataceae bacterium]
MRPVPRRLEVMDDAVAAIMRRKTPAEKLAMLDDMWEFARDLVRAALSKEHPAWSPEELAQAVARRMAYEAE